MGSSPIARFFSRLFTPSQPTGSQGIVYRLGKLWQRSDRFHDRFVAKAAITYGTAELNDKKSDGLKFSHAAIGDSSQRIASSILFQSI